MCIRRPENPLTAALHILHLGKYKMAMKITQPLGIVQCSLPDGSKGFGAGRGKPVA